MASLIFSIIVGLVVFYCVFVYLKVCCKPKLDMTGLELAKEERMSINDFAKKITLQEDKKVQVNIAQVKEILRIINMLTDGFLYKYIRSLKNEKKKA